MKEFYHKLQKALYKEVENYTRLKIAEREVSLPYSRELLNRPHSKPHFVPLSGKGNWQALLNCTLYFARQEGFDLKTAKAEEIRGFMKKWRIGVDCSGFVYNVLDMSLKKIGHPGIDGWLKSAFEDWVFAFGIRVVNTTAFTKTYNTKRVSLQDLLPGDLILLEDKKEKPDHLLLVISKTPSSLVYAHSSGVIGEKDGPRVAEAQIKQGEILWKERLCDGSPLSERFKIEGFYRPLPLTKAVLSYLADLNLLTM